MKDWGPDGPGRYHALAQSACQRWSNVAAELKRVRDRIAPDYAKLKAYLALKHKTADQKVTLLKAFLDTYGTVDLTETRNARQAVELLQNSEKYRYARWCDADEPGLVCAAAGYCEASAECLELGYCVYDTTARVCVATAAGCLYSARCKKLGECNLSTVLPRACVR